MGVSILEGSKIGRIATAVEAIASGMTKTSYTLTVTVVTQDNVTVTGQVVYIRQGGPDGPVYKSAAYDGQPVSFSLPTGFVWYASVSDTLAHHFSPTTAAGIISDANMSCTLTYSDLSHITTAAAVLAALNNNDDLTNLVGEQITCTKTGVTGGLVWDVVDYDKLGEEVTLLLHDTLPDQMQFEPIQALAYFEYGLAAGNYKFKNGNTYYYFTLTQAIPAEGQLRATTSAFQTYQSQDVGTALEEGTVSTTEISGATDLGTCGSSAGTYPLNHMDRVNYGSNNFGESGLFAWLNSDAAANTNLPRVTKFSRPYKVTIPGFLNGLDEDFLDCIADTEWKTSPNSTYECPASMGGIATVGQGYTVTAKFGLASEKEIFGTYTNIDVGDTQYDLFVGSQNADRIKKYNNSARYWWLRTPLTVAYYERAVSTTGAVHTSSANKSHGVVPACKIRKSA